MLDLSTQPLQVKLIFTIYPILIMLGTFPTSAGHAGSSYSTSIVHPEGTSLIYVGQVEPPHTTYLVMLGLVTHLYSHAGKPHPTSGGHVGPNQLASVVHPGGTHSIYVKHIDPTVQPMQVMWI